MNWDLSVFYKGFDDPQIERDFARCDEITVEKQAVLKQGLSVRETLEKYMALSKSGSRPTNTASMLRCPCLPMQTTLPLCS